jgi:hypothetical protein
MHPIVFTPTANGPVPHVRNVGNSPGSQSTRMASWTWVQVAGEVSGPSMYPRGTPEAPLGFLLKREPTLSWNQLHPSYEKGCQGKKLLPAPLRDAGVVTYIQSHLAPHLILRGVVGLVALARRTF